MIIYDDDGDCYDDDCYAGDETMMMMKTAAACRSVARSISTRPHDGFGGSLDREPLWPPVNHHHCDADRDDDFDDNDDGGVSVITAIFIWWWRW